MGTKLEFSLDFQKRSGPKRYFEAYRLKADLVPFLNSLLTGRPINIPEKLITETRLGIQYHHICYNELYPLAIQVDLFMTESFPGEHPEPNLQLLVYDLKNKQDEYFGLRSLTDVILQLTDRTNLISSFGVTDPIGATHFERIQLGREYSLRVLLDGWPRGRD